MPLDTFCGVDLDEAFSYSVPRYLKIKDGVVGISYIVISVGVALGLFLQIFFIDKGYYKSGQVSGISRVQAQAPYPEWRSDSLNISLPFCSDMSMNALPPKNNTEYTVWPPNPSSPFGQYKLRGHVLSDRYNCIALDEKWMITNPLDASMIFLPTRIVSYTETATQCSTSSSATHVTADGRNVLNTTSSECTYTAGPKSRWFVPDVESYTLYIQHSIAVPLLGASFSKDSMVSGSIIDVNGNAVDPCSFYLKRNPAVACPFNLDSPVANATNYIRVGARNVPDIIAVGTLLEAAGVSSLDETGLPMSDSYRYGGLTLIVQMSYDNYFSNALDGWRQVKYTISVQAIPGKVKAVHGVSPTGAVPTVTRQVFEKSGLRIMFVFSGTMGQPSLSTAFISLAAVGQSMTLAVIFIAFIVNYGLRLSPIYRRYITSTTHDFSSVRSKADFLTVFKLFADEHVLPNPSTVLEVLKSLGKKAAAAPSAALMVRDSSQAPPSLLADSHARAPHSDEPLAPHPHNQHAVIASQEAHGAHMPPPHVHAHASDTSASSLAAADIHEIYAFGDDDDSESEAPVAAAPAVAAVPAVAPDENRKGWLSWLGI